MCAEYVNVCGHTPTQPSPSTLHTGMAKPSSLKETIAMHPYLFGSQSLPIPTGGREAGGLSGKKSVSSECLLTLNDEASVNSETLEGT